MSGSGPIFIAIFGGALIGALASYSGGALGVPSPDWLGLVVAAMAASIARTVFG